MKAIGHICEKVISPKWALAVSLLAAFGGDAADTPCNPYGACAHVTRDEPIARTCAMLRVAGMGWVRSDFDWITVEKAKGVWDFSRFDEVVSECEANGLHILPILAHYVPWANPAHEHLDAWEEYVRRIVARYGSRLPVVEVWNEENYAQFWRDPNPTNYIALLRRTYETAKKVNPNVRVALGGTSGVPLGYIEEVYRLGGAKCFDIMNIHPYSHPRRPEGTLDVQIEKLRALMARYGDASKPIWITEIGWPTPRMCISEADLVLAGLNVARPDANAWHVLYVPARSDEEGDADETVRTHLLRMLPEGSLVEVCLSKALRERLAKNDVDCVVYPFTEEYASDSVDAVYSFVKNGGVLVDCGGMPMWTAMCTMADGTMAPDKSARPHRDRERLRIAATAHWMDRRYPVSTPVYPTAAARNVKAPQRGFDAQRFFTGRLLRPGDSFVPLLSASTNGIESVAAAVYRFNSDMKGAVVVSGLLRGSSYGGGSITSSEERQARLLACSLGIAFAEGIETFFWYEFRQPDLVLAPGYAESYCGMVHDNFAPKPAYGAYMTFIGARPAGSVQAAVDWRSADGTFYFPQWTRPDRRKAGMIWTTRAAHRRKLTFSSPNMYFLDVAGGQVRPSRLGNVFMLTLSGSPIYFFGGELKDMETDTKERNGK